MSFLINRKAPSRIDCLHALVKLVYSKFGLNEFKLEDCMFSRDEDNIYNYCSLIEYTDFGLKCPYKESPLSEAGCYITNGKFDDTTKKKEVGNTVNALHGMGFLKRNNHDIKVTELGAWFAKSNLYSLEAASVVKKAILSYGPVIGAVDEIDYIHKNGIFNNKDIVVGYPSTEETVYENESYIKISSGSTMDANTRSRSCYLSWLVTAGVIVPVGVTPSNDSDIPYLKYRDFLNAETLKARKYKIIMNPKDVFALVVRTEHPLNYTNLTKRTMALRENGQKAVRETTMKYEYRIQNRRFAIMYLLNKTYESNSQLSFNRLYDFMKKHKDEFIISNENFKEILLQELHIANVGGIPYIGYNTGNDILLKPRIGLNLNELSEGAPKSIVELLNEF